MEFYDKVDDMYVNMMKRPIYLWRIKLELLDHYENTVKCIEQDIDYSNAGSITCNNSQGTRKTCSITLINVDLKYIPTEDSPFWFNRKFRIYIGLVDNRHYKQGDSEVHWTNETDTYWFSKGVYITQDIHVDSTAHTVSITGIDKFGQLDGSLNVLQADEMNTVFEVGSPIRSVVEDILSLNIGNGQVLDPITPMVQDESLNSIYLYKEFTLSAGQYYGDFLNELATSYGAEIFYDNIGRLVIRRSFADDFPYWIGFRGVAQEFNYFVKGYQNPQETVKLTGVNKIIVSTDNVETPNASYTAINTNPRSPLCYNKIGARTLPENGGVIIINAGNIVDEESQEADPTLQGESEALVKKRCRDYAEYRLMQETCLGTSISYECPPYLHLNEGDVIAITDPDFGLDCDLYIINSITFPLGADAIQLEISNLAFLNSDISSQTQFSALSNQPVKFGIHYITGEVSGTPPQNQLIEMGENFITANDYDEETHSVSFSKENSELMYWTDNIHGSVYDIGQEYLVPNQYLSLLANWVDYSDYMLELGIKDIQGVGYPYTFNSLTDQSTDVYSTALLIINDKKYYLWGRNYTPTTSKTVSLEETMIFKYVYIPITDGTLMVLNNQLYNLLYGTYGGKAYYLYYPNAIENLSFDVGASVYLEDIRLPRNIKNLTLQSEQLYNLKTFNFNNQYECTVDMTNCSVFLNGVRLTESITADNHVIVMSNGNYACNFLTQSGDVNVPSVNFPKGLRIEHKTANKRIGFMQFGNMTNTESTTLSFGKTDSDDIYKGGLELINCSAFQSNSSPSTPCQVELVIDNLYLDNAYMPISLMKSMEYNGNIKAINGSTLISSSNYINTTLSFEGDNLYIDNANVITYTNLTSVEIYSAFTLLNDGDVLCRNSNLTTIHFYNSVNIDCGNTRYNVLFITNNANLTDVYFHDDNFTVTNASNGVLFQSNNANFKLHGIANGNVQAYADANSIPFEAIVTS